MGPNWPRPGNDSQSNTLGCFWGVLMAVSLWVVIAIVAAIWNGVKFDG